MQIFTSFHGSFSSNNGSKIDYLKIFDDKLKSNGHSIYPKSVIGALGAPQLYNLNALDYFFRDEDMAIAFITKEYLSDPWLISELHAMYMLKNKIERDFILPLISSEIPLEKLPPICYASENYIKFDVKKLDDSFFENLLNKINDFAKPKLSVFISHSTKDAEIATVLATLIKNAYGLTNDDDIFCSSVAEYGIPLSANINETLLRLIFEARVFVCIASQNSFGNTDDSGGSFYTSVELGARWGMRRYIAIMLASKNVSSSIKAPFNTLNVLTCDDKTQISQFIKQIGFYINKPLQRELNYEVDIEKLVETSIKFSNK